MDVTDLYLKGTDLRAGAVRKLEKQLLSDPGKVENRMLLLGFYAKNRFNRVQYKKDYIRHVLWMVRHHPESEAIGKPFCRLHPMDGSREWNRTCRMFKRHLVEKPNDIPILRGAANFHVLGDRKSSEKHFKKLIKLEPKNPHWLSRLAHLHELDLIGLKENHRSYRIIASKALTLKKQAYMLSKRKEEKFYLLDDLGPLAFKAGLSREASNYARRLLKLAPRFKDNWNYGNAIHSGHSTMGLIALQQRKMKQARLHLIASVKHKGSPQLDSFGPKFDLAKALLAVGEKKIVISYLRRCTRFWDGKRALLDGWLAEIRATGTTSFQRKY